MKSKKIGLDFVSCGGVVHVHAEAFKKIRQVEVKAFVDIDDKALSKSMAKGIITYLVDVSREKLCLLKILF